MKKIKGLGAIEMLIAFLLIACISVYFINLNLKKIDTKTQSELNTTQEEINQKIDNIMQQREDLKTEQERKLNQLQNY